MNQKKFGKIVKSLRQEQIEYQSGCSWTQKDLALATDLSEGTISKIEQGRRANLTGDELRRISDALRLSNLELQEFYIAGTAVYKEEEIAEQKDTQNAFDTIWNRFSLLQLPSYLTDSLSSLIGINEPMMRFHGITLEILEKNRQSEVGCNMLSIFFRPDSPLRSAMSHRWYEPAISNIRQFQFTALRYRYSSHFEKMFPLLYKLPDFSSIWQQSRSHPTDIFSMAREFDYSHVKYGPVHYVATVTPTVTPHGPIYMTVFVPCNSQTRLIFDNLLQNEMKVQKIMAWPVDELII